MKMYLQQQNENRLKARASVFLCGDREESVEDILDDVQLAYNGDYIGDSCYTYLMDILECYIGA